MREWAYRRLDLNDTPRRRDDIDVLNQAGSEGWELVAVTGNKIAYLKREIVEPAKPGRSKAAAPASNE